MLNFQNIFFNFKKIEETKFSNLYLAENKDAQSIFIKEIRPPFVYDQDVLAKFQSENETLQLFSQQPYFAKCYGYFEEGESKFIALEYLNGKSLREIRSDLKTINPLQIKQWLKQTAQALSILHHHPKISLIHSDLNPGNIILTEENQIKVIDFSIAQMNQNLHGLMEGTFHFIPVYTAPELVRQEQFDSRADIFSLGVIFYELLQGSLPYPAQNYTELLIALDEITISKNNFDTSIDPQLKQVLIGCLQKNPQDRFQDIQEVLDIIN